jgi:hypothetical protein
MDAYDVMREWDRATGRQPRTVEEYDAEVPALLGGRDYAEWKAGLEERRKDAIVAGMKIWGLPIEPLGGFEVDAHIPTVERHD